jgi:hypothetical protein
MRAFSWKGILLGGITDIFATGIVAFPLAIVAAVRTNFAGVPASELGKALVAAVQASPGLRIAYLVLVAMCSVLGGYVAAREAKRGELLNGALSAFLCVGLGINSMLGGHSTIPLWQHLASFVASPLLGAYGGYLWTRSADGVLIASGTSVHAA